MRVRLRLMIVSSSCIMHMESPTLTILGTLLKESDDLVILGVTFDTKMIIEKRLRSVSRAASQRFGILRVAWQVFYGRLLLVRCFRGCSARCGVLFFRMMFGCRYVLNYLTVLSVVHFFTGD